MHETLLLGLDIGIFAFGGNLVVIAASIAFLLREERA